MLLGHELQIFFGEPVGFGNDEDDIRSGFQEFSFEIFVCDFVAVIFISALFLDFFDGDACEVNVL